MLRLWIEAVVDLVEFNATGHPGVNALRVSINNQARAAGVPPCALAAIVANETGGQNILQHGMPPGPGCGVGLCQITSGVDWSNIDQPTYQADGRAWALLDPSSNLYVAAKYYLAPTIYDMLDYREKYPALCARFSSEILYFVFAAYNAGSGAVFSALRAGHDPDGYTTSYYATRAISFYRAFVTESHNHAQEKK